MVAQEEWLVELRARRTALWKIVEKRQCDLGLVYGSLERNEPFRYVTNFVPSLGDMWGILRREGEMTCLLNFNWQLEEAREVSGIEEWAGFFDVLPVLVDRLGSMKPRRLAVFGLERIPWKAIEIVRKSMPKLVMEDADPDFTALRRRKTPFEIRVLREAVHITDQAIDLVRSEIHPGMKEKEVAARVSYYFSSQGAQNAFFPMVLAGTDRPAMCRVPGDYAFKQGDPIMIDVGATWQGYQADVGRTYVFGKASSLQQRIWDTILRAYEAVLDLARPGTPCRDLHRAAVKIYEAAGFKLLHRIGHGYGLATSFEWPSLDSEEAPLEPGMTIAVEPGIYVQGANAMKLEEDLVITETGCEVLSKASRELVIHS